MPGEDRPGSSEEAITSALAPADRSKYSHHSATEPANDTTNAATVAPVMCRVADRVAPMMTIDSPIAIRMNAWHRSAKWPPSIVQEGERAADDAPGEDPLEIPLQPAAQRDHHEHAAAHLLHGVGGADHPAEFVEGARQRRRHRQAEQREHDEQQPDLATIASSSADWSALRTVGCCTRLCDSCVTAKTYTRSKNSSMFVTR